MPTPTKGPRLGGGPAHERALLANLATALFEHGGITTTQAKARRLRPLAERLVTQAKKGDLHNRRLVLATVRDQSVVHRLFTEIAPGFAQRPGGYTRITKLMPRKGDNAPMARIELVEALTVAQEAVGEAERARGSRFLRRGAVRPAEVPTVAASTAPAEPAPVAVIEQSGTTTSGLVAATDVAAGTDVADEATVVDTTAGTAVVELPVDETTTAVVEAPVATLAAHHDQVEGGAAAVTETDAGPKIDTVPETDIVPETEARPQADTEGDLR